MKINNPNSLRFDFSYLLENKIGEENGLSKKNIQDSEPLLQKAFNHLSEIRQGKVLPHNEPALFTQLPYQSSEELEKIKTWAKNIKSKYENIISIGIGGSYLGNKTLQESLSHPYYNECSSARNGFPKIYFAGDNLDPARLKGLLDIIDIKSTHFLIISKSGNTIEPMGTFAVLLDAIQKSGGNIKEDITAITSEDTGMLCDMVKSHGWKSFPIPYGVGGRWSVLSTVGLVTAAVAGINIDSLLEGSREMDKLCQKESIEDNPAALYALLHHLLHKNKGKNLGVIMPYANALKSVSDWYVQLLAESLGKKFNLETQVVHEGRTPIPALGTTDMHAQTQQHCEGDNSRVITFIEIEEQASAQGLTIPDVFSPETPISSISNRKMQDLLHMACLSNEEALAQAERPTCSIVLPEITPFYMGQLLYFFEYATAFEGELLNVNAYDQPGVEGYKKVMKSMLKKSIS
ncbi:hypothetical protein AB834_05665 [PVC group bacterium (ex Bugula neritina AB1)]|nr:hypothetical protein AB834_05665 [PVC group bacterium (ex Bugula neritina AB1)]